MSEGVNEKNESIDVASVVDKDDFIKLDPAVQNKIIDGKWQENKHKMGILGELFGTNSIQIAMYGALVIALVMLLITLLEFICYRYSGYSMNMDLIEKMFSIITLILGYLFGKGKD